MITLNNVVTLDAFGPTTTLEGNEDFRQVNLDISFANIFYSIKQPVAGDLQPDSWQWSEEIFATASFQSLERRLSGIRIRSAIAGAPATVTLTLLNNRDLGRA